MNKPAPTPDSVPSLAELSIESAEEVEDDDDDDDDEIARVLFESESPAKHQVESSEAFRGKEVDKASDFPSSDVSVASEPYSSQGSEATLGITASNHKLFEPSAPESSTSPDEPDGQHFPNSCHGGLNLAPRDLADIFTMFQGNQRYWPPAPSPPVSLADSGTDAVTAVASNLGTSNTTSWERKVDSLERECTTLKDIIKADSITILKLKGEIETLRSKGNGPEIRRLKSELDLLRRENGCLRERDAQHVETVRILKEEVNKLSKLNYASANAQKAVEQLRLENELFASQIIENEAEIRRTCAIVQQLKETALQAKRDENLTMDNQPKMPKQDNRNDTESETSKTDGVVNTTPKKDTSVTHLTPWEAQIESLAARLDALERKQSSRDVPPSPSQTVDDDSESDGVEVSVDGKVVGDARQEEGKKEEKNEEWSGLCDCFLQSHYNDE
jgi:hypothetical protein